jgi:uncharacterized protein YbjQ (UPF0145 family)
MDEDRQPETGRDGSDMPPFDLPPWGSGGAPAYTERRATAPRSPESARTPVVVTVEAIEGARRTLGLVAGEASHPVGDDMPARASEVARAAAVERLVEAASELGATAVVGTRFSIAAGDGIVTVLVTGTAVAGPSTV